MVNLIKMFAHKHYIYYNIQVLILLTILTKLVAEHADGKNFSVNTAGVALRKRSNQIAKQDVYYYFWIIFKRKLNSD